MKIILSIIKWTLLCCGAMFLIMGILAFTPVPFYMHRNLGENVVSEKDSVSKFFPDYIVMFGGAGMPSKSNLLRLFYTAEYAKRYKKPVILVHPKDSVCQVEMTRFLVNYGISKKRIYYMTGGGNTRSQVISLADTFPHLKNSSLLIVTSPEHLSRTLKCMEKCKFKHIRGAASFEETVDFDTRLTREKLQGNTFVPTVNNLNLRYTYWNYLELEIICLREYFAIAYYWIKDWI